VIKVVLDRYVIRTGYLARPAIAKRMEAKERACCRRNPSIPPPPAWVGANRLVRSLRMFETGRGERDHVRVMFGIPVTK